MKTEDRKTMSRIKTIFGALLIAVLCMGMGVVAYAETYLSSCTVTGTDDYTGYHAEVNGNKVTINALDGYTVDENTSVTLNGKAAKYVSKNTNTEEGVTYYTFEVSSSSSSDKKDDDDDEDHEPPSWVKNPNQKPALVMSAPAIGGGATLGWQEQGDLGKLVFSMARPAGWSEAFSFNMLKGGKPDYSLKSGTMQLYIPHEYLKTGRIYAIIGIDKNGNAVVFNDVDTNPLTITVNLNIEGYAFDLIYTN